MAATNSVPVERTGKTAVMPPLPAVAGETYPFGSLRNEIDRVFDDFFRGWPGLPSFPSAFFGFDPFKRVAEPLAAPAPAFAPKVDVLGDARGLSHRGRDARDGREGRGRHPERRRPHHQGREEGRARGEEEGLLPVRAQLRHRAAQLPPAGERGCREDSRPSSPRACSCWRCPRPRRRRRRSAPSRSRRSSLDAARRLGRSGASTCRFSRVARGCNWGAGKRLGGCPRCNSGCRSRRRRSGARSRPRQGGGSAGPGLPSRAS